MMIIDGGHLPKRTRQMVKMRLEDKMLLKDIGDEFGVSRERVRQLIGNTGHLEKPGFIFICQCCKTERTFRSTKVNLSRKYCDLSCKAKGMWKGEKPMREYTIEEWKEYHRQRNAKTKEYRHQWYLANKEKCKKRNQTPEAKVYFREYFKRPEVKERINKRNREKYQLKK